MPATTARGDSAEGSGRPLPSGAELTPLNDTFRDDPYPVLERLRDERRVYWDEGLSRWFVTGFEEIRALLRNKEMSSNPHNALAGSYSSRVVAGARETGLSSLMSSILFMDDPDHRRVRSVVSKPFSTRAVELLRPRIREFSEQLLDGITDEKFDVMKSLAEPLPVIVIAEMLGVDLAERDNFKRWSESISAAIFNPIRDAGQPARAAAAAEAIEALSEYLTRVIESRKREPADDLISSMIAPDEGSKPLTGEEILAQCQLLLVAGNVTTTDLIGNSVRALLTHPEQLAVLRADPSLIPDAIEEVLRYDTPVTQATRVVPRDMSFGGCPFHQGQSITLSLAGANRDPRANPEPDRFDIRRKDVRYHSFGGNKHLCLGATLAHVEAQEAVSALLRRYPDLELLEQEYHYRTWPGFRGTQELWLGHG
jgi:cytochrome P450